LTDYLSDDEALLAGEQWDPQRRVKLREKSRASEFAITHFRGFQLKTQYCQYWIVSKSSFQHSVLSFVHCSHSEKGGTAVDVNGLAYYGRRHVGTEEQRSLGNLHGCLAAALQNRIEKSLQLFFGAEA
jgi:hypothetical protein